MIKKTILILMSIFLVWQSYGILSIINKIEMDSWWLILLLAFLINLFITGVFAFLGFALPTQKLISNAYYSVKKPNKLKKIYTFLKVDRFRKLLLATFWRNKAQRKRYFNGKPEGISILEMQSKKSEFGHLLPFIIITTVCVYLIVLGLITLAIITFIINIIGNFYPIILQRHHRMRIQLLRKRMYD
jgi:hypothetical protein